MIDVDQLPDEVVNAILRNRGFEPDSEEGHKMIARLSPREAMDYYLRWKGIIGFTSGIIEAWDAIKSAERPAEGATNNPINRK